MKWLPWLNDTQRDQVRKRILETASKEIETRHWGTLAHGDSPGKVPRMYILDVRGLLLAAGVIRYTLSQFGTRVLYRGQSKDWHAQVSLFRGAKTGSDATKRVQWLTKALTVIAPLFDPKGTSEQREALAQHYGLPTRWLDVVDTIHTAAWFAHYLVHKNVDESPGTRDDAVGYIGVFAFPQENGHHAVAIDLRTKPSEYLRPHVQQSWAIRAKNPDANLGRLNHLQVATFIVPTPLLAQWSAAEAFTPRVMFPNIEEDHGAYFWSTAEEALRKKKLWPMPWRPASQAVADGSRLQESYRSMGRDEDMSQSAGKRAGSLDATIAND